MVSKSVLEHPRRMARWDVPARPQWQSVVRSAWPREDYSPPCLWPLTMKVNRGEGGGTGPNNPKGSVKGGKKGMPGRKPGAKVKVREVKAGGVDVSGGGGRKGGGANSSRGADGGWGLAPEAVPLPSSQPCEQPESRPVKEASSSKATGRGKKAGGKGWKDAQTREGEGGKSGKPAGGTEGKRKIGSAKQTSTPSNNQNLPKKKTRKKNNPPTVSTDKKKKKAENSIKNVKTKTSGHKRLLASKSELENENSPNVPQLKDNKYSHPEKKSDSEKNPKVKSERGSRTDVEEVKRSRKKLDKATMAKRKLNRMKKLGFLSAPPRR